MRLDGRLHPAHPFIPQLITADATAEDAARVHPMRAHAANALPF